MKYHVVKQYWRDRMFWVGEIVDVPDSDFEYLMDMRRLEQLGAVVKDGDTPTPPDDANKYDGSTKYNGSNKYDGVKNG